MPAGKLLYFRTKYSLLTQEYVGWRPVTLVMVSVTYSRGGVQTMLGPGTMFLKLSEVLERSVWAVGL